MTPLPEVLDHALEAMGSAEEEIGRQNERLQRILDPLQGSAGHSREILSEARVYRDPEGLVERYCFPLWADYEFEVEYHSADRFFTRLWFVRAAGSAVPAGEPTPWTWLKDETLQRYEDVKELTLWLPYETYDVLDPQDGKCCFLRFGWHVLQEIDEM
ncbi:hypothetical protein ACIRBY_14820 [Streptomyces sp. NPDC096136]|uniref:hypothetical protein n=1 Tax=Streptomyces sp. NPDC096136 TaxID=3366076 RepID=UPI00381AE336